MATTVFGVGVGLVILISVWLVSLCICLVSLRTNRNAGPIALITACILTVSLFLIPLESKTPTPAAHKIYDEVFIWRSSLVILLTASAVVGTVSFLVKHLMEPRFARPVSKSDR